MAVNLDDFMAVLAGCLAAIVPAGFHVRVSGGILLYSADEGRFPGQSGNYQVGLAGTDVRANFGYCETVEDNIVRVAVLALDDLQDFIDEATHDPWPGTRTPPRPHGRLTGSMLHLWYGENDNAVLACEPIPLAGIMPPG